jgi:hypothetical protein
MMKTPIVLLLLLTLAACSGDPAAPPTPDNAAGDAVQRYLQARIDGDADALARLLCAEREGDARREAASFAAVEASLRDVTCTFDAATTTVTCTGAIVAIYDGEGRDIEIPRYRVVQEDGEWKVCGEA